MFPRFIAGFDRMWISPIGNADAAVQIAQAFGVEVELLGLLASSATKAKGAPIPDDFTDGASRPWSLHEADQPTHYAA